MLLLDTVAFAEPKGYAFGLETNIAVLYTLLVEGKRP
jgi:hypothetical protein